MKITTKDFIEKAIAVHGDKYDYSKAEYVNNRTKVCIICPEHGEFWQTPRQHLNGYGCRKCTYDGFRLGNDEFIKRAKEIHGDKYDYSKVEYVNANSKVCIICPEHGEFWQTPNAHIKLKEGCPFCNGKNKTTDTFIKLAKSVHGDKYDYSKVEYVNANSKVCIICPEHGEFWQRASSHLNGYGCRKCAYDEKRKHNLLSNDEFIKRAKEIHGDKYDYSKVEYVNYDTKVCIICPEHGEFWQTPVGHLSNAQGCPKCKKSKLENSVEAILKECKIQYEQEKEFEWLVNKNNLKLDFYIPKYDIAIECQGGQHFVPVPLFGGKSAFEEDITLDKLKYDLCKEHGIDIIYLIPYKYRNNETFKINYKDKKCFFFNDLKNMRKYLSNLREIL